jgi:hypothetical protein
MRNIFVIVMIAAPAFLSAQSHSQPSTLISAGPTYVLGAASKWSETGYNIQVGREFGHFGPTLFRVEALYLQRSGNGQPFSSMTQRTYALAGSIVLHSSGRLFAPFASAGFGLYGDNSWSVYSPGIHAGVGLETSIARVRFFAESRVHQYLRDARIFGQYGGGVTLVPLSFGVRF